MAKEYRWFPCKNITQPDVFAKAAEEVFAANGLTADDVETLLIKAAQAALTPGAPPGMRETANQLQGQTPMADLRNKVQSGQQLFGYNQAQPYENANDWKVKGGLKPWDITPQSISRESMFRANPAKNYRSLHYAKPFADTDTNPYLAHGIPEGEDTQKVTYGTTPLAMDDNARLNRVRQMYARQLFPARAAAIDAGERVGPMTQQQLDTLNRFYESQGIAGSEFGSSHAREGQMLALPTYKPKTGMDAVRHWAEAEYDKLDPTRAERRTAGEEVSPLNDAQVAKLWETYKPEGADPAGKFYPGNPNKQSHLTYHPQQYREAWLNKDFYGPQEEAVAEPEVSSGRPKPKYYGGPITGDSYWRQY